MLRVAITMIVCVWRCMLVFPLVTYVLIALNSSHESEQVMPAKLRLVPPSHSVYYVWSGSRLSDRLPLEMTPVTERSTANLQASFCLNSQSPCCQILIFSSSQSLPVSRLSASLLLHLPPTPTFSNTQTATSVTKITLTAPSMQSSFYNTWTPMQIFT